MATPTPATPPPQSQSSTAPAGAPAPSGKYEVSAMPGYFRAPNGQLYQVNKIELGKEDVISKLSGLSKEKTLIDTATKICELLNSQNILQKIPPTAKGDIYIGATGITVKEDTTPTTQVHTISYDRTQTGPKSNEALYQEINQLVSNILRTGPTSATALAQAVNPCSFPSACASAIDLAQKALQQTNTQQLSLQDTEGLKGAADKAAKEAFKQIMEKLQVKAQELDNAVAAAQQQQAAVSQETSFTAQLKNLTQQQQQSLTADTITTLIGKEKEQKASGLQKILTDLQNRQENNTKELKALLEKAINTQLPAVKRVMETANGVHQTAAAAGQQQQPTPTAERQKNAVQALLAALSTSQQAEGQEPGLLQAMTS